MKNLLHNTSAAPVMSVFPTSRSSFRLPVGQHRWVFILLWLLATTTVLAQTTTCDELVAIPEAEKKYQTGNFDDVFALLTPCIDKGFSENARVQALKIMSMTYLAIDSLDQSTRTISRLLTLNPRYEPDFSASPRYKALVQQIKNSQEQIIQVTSVSKKAENILYVPATVMVLTSKDFVQRGYQSLEQVLHDLPGFDVVKGNGPGYSNFYQRGYRSTSNDRILMLIDGVEENDLASSSIPLSRQYALSDIDRIEVIYGPASTMYGANAFTGVINVITKNFRNLTGPTRQLAFTGQARAGSLNTRYFDGVLTAKTSDIAFSLTTRIFQSDERDLSGYPEWNFSARTAADYTGLLFNRPGSSDNVSPLLYTNGPSSTTMVTLTQAGAEKAAKLDNNLFGNTLNGNPVGFNDRSTDWMIRAKLEFKDLTISLLNWKTDEGAMPWYTNKSHIPTDKTMRWITNDRAFSITYSKYISDKFQLLNITSVLLHEINGNTNLVTYDGYYNGELQLKDLARDSVARVTPTYNYRISNQLRNELRLFWTPSSRIDVSNGIEFRRSLIQGNYITSLKPQADETGTVGTASGTLKGGNNFQTLDVGVYSQLTYRPTTDLKLVGGLRVDNNRIRTNGGYGTVINPRLAIIYTWNQLIIKGIYATAFKDASFLQKYATTDTRALPNPNLLPERVKNTEFSLTYQPTKQLAMNVIGYLANYNNAVGTEKVPYGDGFTQQFQAVGSRYIWGLQGDISYRTSRLNVWGNFTYTNPKDLKVNKRISDIANYMINAGGDYQLTSKLSLYVSGNYVSERLSGTATSGSKNPISRFDPYLILNANLTYNNLLRGLSVQASANNLLDKEYFVPGIRDADIKTGASRFPQDRRLLSLGVYYTFTPIDYSPPFHTDR